MKRKKLTPDERFDLEMERICLLARPNLYDDYYFKKVFPDKNVRDKILKSEARRLNFLENKLS